jgi:erythromycin esterase-like protein
MQAHQHLIDIINESVQPLTGQSGQYQSLLDNIGNSRFVLMGEASHGTHEFYQARIDITRELIENKGFMAVAIEGDWPDVYQMHRYIQGAGDANDPISALTAFKRFPTWMWRNTTLPPFLRWLRDYNDKLANPAEKIGIYGLDLYSMYSSMQAVIYYLF